MPKHNPVFCALDTSRADQALAWAKEIAGHVGGLKVGLEFFLANGVSGYRQIADLGLPIFLDVKLHDIPNTVRGGIGSLLPLQPAFITVHTSGGGAMMAAAAEAAAKAGANRPKLLGVTVLTSLDTADLTAVGQSADVPQQVTRLARLAQQSGLDGVICSPAEVALLRKACGPDFILMVPGIRPPWAASQDQKRVMTPAEAMAAGATYLVVGRPITGAEDRNAAAKRLAEELAA